MTRDKIPIDEMHASEVEAKLARLQAAGPAPRKTWTRQALVERLAATVTSLRAAGFSLNEIADAMSHNGVTYSPEMLSSCLSRLKHGTAGNGVNSKAQPKKVTKKPTLGLAPATNRATSPPQEATLHAGNGSNDVVAPVTSDPPTAITRISLNPQPAETKDQDPVPLNIGGAATPKTRNAWLGTVANRRAPG